MVCYAATELLQFRPSVVSAAAVLLEMQEREPTRSSPSDVECVVQACTRDDHGTTERELHNCLAAMKMLLIRYRENLDAAEREEAQRRLDALVSVSAYPCAERPCSTPPPPITPPLAVSKHAMLITDPPPLLEATCKRKHHNLSTSVNEKGVLVSRDPNVGINYYGRVPLPRKKRRCVELPLDDFMIVTAHYQPNSRAGAMSYCL